MQWPTEMKRLGTLQFSFLFLNVLFWAVGIGIVGFVSWTLSSLPSNTEFLSVAFAFLYVILFLGLVIAATGLLGCLGGLFRSICLLKLYIGLMVAFVFVEVAIAIGAYTQKDQIPTLITSTWPQLNNDTKFTLQAGLECCGVNNYTEYGAHLADLPLSCFKVYDTLSVHTKSWTLLFTTPCLQQLQHWFDANLPVWATILVLICLIQFMSMGLSVGVMVGIEERTKVHPAPDPPDEEQPADGATIVCSESPHPQSSRMSEFSDQQSLSSGDTTNRKLSQVPEEEEDYLSSGVVCCDSKDDLSTTRSPASSVRHLVTEGTEETGVGKDEVNEEEAVISEGTDKSEDSIPSHRDLLVAYSEETRRYENQPTPETNELDNFQSTGLQQNSGENAAQQDDVRGQTASPISSQPPEDTSAGDRDEDNIDDVTTGRHVDEGRMGIQTGLEGGVQFQENDVQHQTLESDQHETSKDADNNSNVQPSESEIKTCELQEGSGDKLSNKNLRNHEEVTLCREGTFDISKDENRASQNN